MKKKSENNWSTETCLDQDFEVTKLDRQPICVHFIARELTQDEAITECSKRNASLPVPTTNDQNSALRVLMDRKSNSRKSEKNCFLLVFIDF